jgi:hypothetical protein
LPLVPQCETENANSKTHCSACEVKVLSIELHQADHQLQRTGLKPSSEHPQPLSWTACEELEHPQPPHSWTAVEEYCPSCVSIEVNKPITDFNELASSLLQNIHNLFMVGLHVKNTTQTL